MQVAALGLWEVAKSTAANIVASTVTSSQPDSTCPLPIDDKINLFICDPISSTFGLIEAGVPSLNAKGVKFRDLSFTPGRLAPTWPNQFLPSVQDSPLLNHAKNFAFTSTRTIFSSASKSDLVFFTKAIPRLNELYPMGKSDEVDKVMTFIWHAVLDGLQELKATYHAESGEEAQKICQLLETLEMAVREYLDPKTSVIRARSSSHSSSHSAAAAATVALSKPNQADEEEEEDFADLGSPRPSEQNLLSPPLELQENEQTLGPQSKASLEQEFQPAASSEPENSALAQAGADEIPTALLVQRKLARKAFNARLINEVWSFERLKRGVNSIQKMKTTPSSTTLSLSLQEFHEFLDEQASSYLRFTQSFVKEILDRSE